jgi:hypothetical protein
MRSSGMHSERQRVETRYLCKRVPAYHEPTADERWLPSFPRTVVEVPATQNCPYLRERKVRISHGVRRNENGRLAKFV